MMKIKTQLLLTCLLLWSIDSTTWIHAANQLQLTAEDIQSNRVELSGPWKYQPGDDSTWARPDFNDQSWSVVNPFWLSATDIPLEKWQAVGWFRLHLTVDSTLRSRSFNLFMQQAGKAEVYFNGALLVAFKQKDDFQTEITFPPQKETVVAVRFSNPDLQGFRRAQFPAGFKLRLETIDQMVARLAREKNIIQQQVFFTVLALVFGLLHLILYLFMPRSKGNIYFVIFLFVYALGIFSDIQGTLRAVHQSEVLFYLRIHRLTWPLSSIFFLRFVYQTFAEKVPRQFWIIVFAYLAVAVPSIYQPYAYSHYIILIDMIMGLEVVRLVYLALQRKQEDTWIFASGLFFIFLFSAYDWLLDLGLIAPIFQQTNAYYIGLVGLFITTSTYLARDITRTHTRLIQQELKATDLEIQQKILEADNERKTKELEEARKLQLAMLPHEIPELPQLQIAVYMKTAFEVGGDYYDFYMEKDGTLTVAIGDATGHGMKAGIMVTLMKSLFNSMGNTFYIPDFFHHCTRMIRRMHLGNLYMALMLIRIRGSKLVISSAGMPPVFIFRKAKKSVEEITIKGLPLGGVEGYAYKQIRTELASGDTILLLSDGFPELFNTKNEMLDYPRVKALFQETAESSPDEIIQALTQAAEKWRQTRQQNDDITFVVLQFNNNKPTT